MHFFSWVCVNLLSIFLFIPIFPVVSESPSPSPFSLLLFIFSLSTLFLFSFPLSSLCSHSSPFSSKRGTGAGGLEITCTVLCFRPDTVINHCPSHTSTYNNKDWLLCGGCHPIAFHCVDAKLDVNGHSQTLLPCPQTVSSFRYLSISALSVELLRALPRGLRLLGGGSDLLLRLFWL